MQTVSTAALHAAEGTEGDLGKRPLGRLGDSRARHLLPSVAEGRRPPVCDSRSGRPGQRSPELG